MAIDGGRPLVLASGSGTRRTLLESVGLVFEVVSPPVDEAALKRAWGQTSAGDLAARLAAAKARAVSAMRPAALVIGADQVLDLDGDLFDKPASIEAAAGQLRRLKGRTHTLQSAVAIAVDERIRWQTINSAHLTMRNFSDACLSSYLTAAGASVLTSVGAYRIEGSGLQLFDRIDGEHTTILGLPMLPLLAELRRLGVLPE